jgi:hypothetical protein
MALDLSEWTALGTSRLMRFNLLDRPEKYLSQMDGADRERSRQRHGNHRRDDYFYGARLADHRADSL